MNIVAIAQRLSMVSPLYQVRAIPGTRNFQVNAISKELWEPMMHPWTGFGPDNSFSLILTPLPGEQVKVKMIDRNGLTSNFQFDNLTELLALFVVVLVRPDDNEITYFDRQRWGCLCYSLKGRFPRVSADIE